MATMKIAGLSLLLVSSMAQAEISAGEISNMVEENMSTEVSAPPLALEPGPYIPVSKENRQSLANPVPTVSTTGSSLPALSSRYELVVFFLSTCPHCARFLPIMKDYANQHGIQVLAFSEDGPGEVNYPNPLPATAEILGHFGHPQMVPALYLVDKNNVNVPPYPVIQGEESEAALDQQMQALANQLGVSL